MKHEIKRMQFKMEEYDEEEGIFSGYGAVFGNIDSGGDIIEPGAFTKSLATGWERVKILALHNDGMLPIGRPLELREDEKGLFLRAKISDTAMGRDIKVLLRDGVLNELSIGYDAVTFDIDENQIRHLKEVELWEVSVVTWAMNPEARILDYKSLKETAAQALLDAQGTAAGGNLEALKEASKSMKEAAKSLDAAIWKAEGCPGTKGGSEARDKPEIKARPGPGNRKGGNENYEVEILF